jgi:hypothetical protein
MPSEDNVGKYMSLVADDWVVARNNNNKEIFLSKGPVHEYSIGDVVQILNGFQFPIRELVVLVGGHELLVDEQESLGTNDSASIDLDVVHNEVLVLAQLVHQVVDVRRPRFTLDGYPFASPEMAVISSVKPMIAGWDYSACMDFRTDRAFSSKVRRQLPTELLGQADPPRADVA